MHNASAILPALNDPEIRSCPPGKAGIAAWETEHAETFGEDSPWYGDLPAAQELLLSDLTYHEARGRSLLGNVTDSSAHNQMTFVEARRHKAEALAAARRLSVEYKMSWPQIAEHSHIPIERVAELFVKSPNDAAAALKIEAHVRSGDWDGTADQLCRMTRWDVGRVRYLLGRIGITTEATEKRRNGGGFKYGPEVYVEIERMRSQGSSYNQIAKELCMTKNTVAQICRRRNYGIGR